MKKLFIICFCTCSILLLLAACKGKEKADNAVGAIPADKSGITNNTNYDTTGISDFVNITDVVPDAILEIRYYSTYNFIGVRVDGYWQQPHCSPGLQQTVCVPLATTCWRKVTV